jgi:alpha-tubulin suppressor-like RCC1 family protein
MRSRSVGLLLASIILMSLILMSLSGCREDAESPTAPEAGPALAAAAVSGLSFKQVSVGQSHTCAVSVDSLAYCWGYNFTGQLGDGTQTDRATPVRVATTRRFLGVSAGTAYTCGITVSHQAFCWGGNSTYGTLGDGTTVDVRLKPVAVAGGLHFRQVAAGNSHTCAVTLDDKAYCWGSNSFGPLGDGTEETRLVPVPVHGGLKFRQLDTGLGHTCGVTLTNSAWCWGNNSSGELGRGPPQDESHTPVRVLGGLQFRRVIAGFTHTCGETTDNKGYCWGSNLFGESGDGTNNNQRLTPVAVVGGLQFDRIGAGGRDHTCGLTLDHKAYCWGSNDSGQLGIGTNEGLPIHVGFPFSSRPRAVVGGLLFVQLSAYYQHTCGVTTDSRVYCWGSNNEGQLGDGTHNNSLSPVKVAGQL